MSKPQISFMECIAFGVTRYVKKFLFIIGK